MPSLHLYNSLARRKQPFTPVNADHVRMYVCGPTVYDRAHLGNARSAVVFDVLYRTLKVLYPRVTYARNITDVDDKINAAATAQGCTIDVITARTTAWYHDDMAALHVLSPDVEPRATDYIAPMITLITGLIQQGYAYEAEGHVLFRVSAYTHYGHLSGSTPEAILAGARVETAPYKADPCDFVLWKPSSPDLPGWDSPWGRGRPGWHIECTAMSHDLLGFPFDIHGGGQDLIFPHHENEIAQGACHAACAHDAPPNRGEAIARFWVHNGFLTVGGEKMSKSLGNFVFAHDLLSAYPGEVVRLALLSTHYRHALDWTPASLQQAQQTLDRFYTALQKAFALGWAPSSAAAPMFGDDDPILEALCDDLNTPKALSLLHAHAHSLFTETAPHKAAEALMRGGQRLGLLNHSPDDWFRGGLAKSGAETIDDATIERLIAERHAARAGRDFARADALRAELADHGVILEDNAGTTQWKRSRPSQE